MTLLACLALAASPDASAQQADRPARVFVSVSGGTDADPAYGQVLADALLVGLARARMQPSAWPSFAAAREAAGRNTADYLVLGTWRTSGDSLELSLEAWEPRGRSALAAGAASGKVDLNLDAVAAEALAKVLPALAARFPADTIDAGDGSTVATVGTGTGTMVDVTAGGGAPERWRRFDLAIGGAPLVSTGELAEYAKLGAQSALDIDLRFRAGRGSVAAGLLAGAGWFRAKGVGVADILVIPAGPDVHWTPSVDANPAVSLHAAAGPAVLVAFVGGAGTLAKVSPFVSAGIGADVGLAPALGLRIEADYLVVFEGSMVLQGFTPRLSLRMRF